MTSHVTNDVVRNETILQIISSNIYKVMSYDGLDLMRKLFQTVISYQEIVSSLWNTRQSWNVYGSIGEGVVYPMNAIYHRDIDIVNVLPNNIAVDNLHETQLYGSETRIYLIENVPNRPGYCYLRVIQEGSMFIFPNTLVSLTKDVHGSKYFSGITLKEVVKGFMNVCKVPISFMNDIRDVFDTPNFDLENLEQQGPATCFHFKTQIQIDNIFFSLTKCDSVCVVQCPTWPSSALEWVDRPNKSGWPCQELKQEIVQDGISIAPIGCKQHPSQDIQWRYSFNEAERLLVRSFNSTQAKCYALLKRIIAEFVKPQLGDDVITSYHLKTLMFWTIEEIDLHAWVPANLVECIFLVLKRLTQCIEDENCPSYFIPTENLFREKATLDKKADVLARMHNILSEGWLLLFRLPDFSMNILQDISTEFDTFHNLLSFFHWGKLISYQLEFTVIRMCLAELDVYQIHEISERNAKFSEIINKLTMKIDSLHDEVVKDILKNATARLYSSYGTQCLSLARLPVSDMSINSRNLESAGEIYIDISCCRNQVDCLAKRANYAYMCGKFQSTISTAFDLLQRYLHLRVRAINADIPVSVQVKHYALRILTNNFTHLFDSMLNMFSCSEVIFGKNEIYAIPGNAKVEMFNVGGEEDHVNPLSKFRRCLVADPYFYVTFLAGTELEIMETICDEFPNSHLPVSLNLLGDCYLKTGHIDKAMEKFNLSMKIKNWRNAAPWHIAILVWRKLLDRWSNTRDGDV
ncbi:hypothetical protein ACJMK2_013185 [Sinanodonta woodiana]|uniref:Mab-21-like HhH/H2TH-like domain-containing protein n=1 Tax=Sinanodonta woodiana TaxID=1069815 RepID=A0ABD3UY09_SINWO